MRPSTRARLSAVADAQHGVITSSQLAELGLDLRLPRRGRWPRLAPRTWATTSDVDDVQLLQAIALYAGQDAVASGSLACRRHQLRDVPVRAVADALVPHGRHLMGGGRTRLHQTSRLPTPTVHAGWPVAPVTRAVADASRWCSSLQDVRALVLAAVGDTRTTAQALAAELDAGPRRHSALLARAVVDAARGARSAPEAEAADSLLAVPGMPPFLLNPEIWSHGVLVGVPDGYVPSVGFGWELDSLRHHGSSGDLAHTFDRHRDFSDVGVDLLHVVPARMRLDPAAWAASVRELSRSRTGWSTRPGLVVVPKGPLLVPRGAALTASHAVA